MQRAAIIALLFYAGTAVAQPSQHPPQGERRGPPQEAFDACKGKKDGDAVEAKSPRGDMVKGICRLVMIPARPSADAAGGERQRPAH